MTANPIALAPLREAPWSGRLPTRIHPTRARSIEVGHEIGQLASLLHAGTQRLLRLIREFDELGGWADQDALSCSHWLSWKIGVDCRTAREWLRVSLALADLPLIDAAFERGELSYSKVRAITRVATPATEKLLAHFGRFMTGAQLEKTCRRFRTLVARQDVACGGGAGLKNSADDAETEDSGTAGAGTAGGRWIRTHSLPSGMVRIEVDVHADEAELIIAAARAGREAWRSAARTSAEVSQVNESEVDESEVEPETPGPGIESNEGAEPDLRELRAGGSAEPPAAGEGSARPVKGRPAQSIGLADGLLLAAEAFLSRVERGEVPGVRRGGERHQVVLHVTPSMFASIAPDLAPEGSDPACLLVSSAGSSSAGSSSEDSSPQCAGRLTRGPWLPRETIERICCDAGIVPILESRAGNPLDVGRRRRTIPPSIRRALDVRDGGCRFPGCRHTAFVEAHHVDSWATGGETKLDNLVLLCHAHHRQVHEGGWTLRLDEEGTPRFIGRDGSPLEDRCEVVRAPIDPEAELEADLEPGVPPIDRFTSTTKDYTARPEYVEHVADLALEHGLQLS